MKAALKLNRFVWTIFYCSVICFGSSKCDDDLMDFDFTDLKEIDWNYENDNSNETLLKTTKSMSTTASTSMTKGNSIIFDEHDDEDYEDNQVHPFDWREKVLRNALSKALTNKALRQKFVEVMPILRVLSKQQRLALSAIISAQVNAKKGQELQLDQVRMMFGNDKKLLIPIVYDIANLVGDSARKYIQLSNDIAPAAIKQTALDPEPQSERRKLDLIDSENMEDNEEIGALPSVAMADSSLEDFFDEITDDVLDPKTINDELRSTTFGSSTSTQTTKQQLLQQQQQKQKPKTRAKRHAIASTDYFVHKLTRSIPLSSPNEDNPQRAIGVPQLNTTSFVVGSNGDSEQSKSSSTSSLSTSQSTSTTTSNSNATTLSYKEIEDLAFASLNGTEIDLNETEIDSSDRNQTDNEPLPNPEELIAGPRYRINGNKIRLIRPKIPNIVSKRKRIQQPPQRPQQRIKGPYAAGSSLTPGIASVPGSRKCERFTASMCIRTEDYPLDQIMGSIRRHKNAMSALLAEYHDKPMSFGLDLSEEFDEFARNQRRREDDMPGGSGGSMCQSIVRYARPQKARSASGEWKYIVNTGQHTQTLRLEKCSNPQESCSYLAHNYRSHCSQIYNYHRLLSWDKTRGLHVDIFKVPTCCSCQIDGYRQQFPPLESSIKTKDFSPAYSPEPYSTINEELDYNDDDDDDDLSLQYSNKYNKHKRGSSSSSNTGYHSYDANELQLGSKNVRTKVHAPSPTVGSYLSPPGNNDFDVNFTYKVGQQQPHQYQHHQQQQQQQQSPYRSSSATWHTNNQLEQRRRPYKSLGHAYESESRADLEIASSETHTDKEVNIFGTTIASDKKRPVQQKRKRIYSVPHTAPTDSTTTATASATRRSSSGASSTNPTTTQGHGYRSRNGYGQVHSNAEHNQVPFHGGGGGNGARAGSSSNAVTHQTTATATSYPSSYYTRASGKHTNTKSSSSSSSYASKSYVPSSSASLPTTISTVSASSYPPPLYHIESIFNMSQGQANSGGTKRINYSYHPIIDFFENNSKRSHSSFSPSSLSSSASSSSISSSLASNSPPTFPSSVSSYNERSTLSSNQLYPYKIRKYNSVSRNKSDIAADDMTDLQLQQEREWQWERRIGKGPNGDGRISGNGITKSSHNEDSVWHPVLV